MYFRHSTRVQAERLAIRGTACNLADGSVEVLAVGTAAAVESLRAWLQRGPPAARVDGVLDLEAAADMPIPAGFEIQ